MKFTALLVLSVVGLAAASCPNMCSGHGWCDENDRCICFRAPGTANKHAAYTAADCSQRVCPYGISHDIITDSNQELLPIWSPDKGDKYIGFLPFDNDYSRSSVMRAFLSGGFLLSRDYGVDVRVVSTVVDLAGTASSVKFQWKLSTQKTYNPEVTAKASSSLYLARKFALHLRPDNQDTGLFIYFDAPTAPQIATMVAGDRYWLNVTGNDGVAFLTSDPNTAHQSVECSGRGTCERGTGQCTCIEGYTGDACQRTVCLSDCSGHGVCQSEQYFVADAFAGTALSAYSYNAFDAQSNYGCKCDDGFRGADCSARECPSGNDPLKGDGAAQGLDCSGRGMCDYTDGQCKCFKGFFGERCEEQSTLM